MNKFYGPYSDIFHAFSISLALKFLNEFSRNFYMGRAWTNKEMTKFGNDPDQNMDTKKSIFIKTCPGNRSTFYKCSFILVSGFPPTVGLLNM